MMGAINYQALMPLVAVVPSVSTKLTISDYLGAVRVRWGFGRSDYRIKPGLYKVGNPNSSSDLFISANYKLSFDALRKNLNGIDGWILVIDTKGINVWCAAGKGVFATNNLVKSINENSLKLIVSHRKIIVPQLAATGVAAHLVYNQTGFRVIFGPVRAADIKPFLNAGYKATPEMRKMVFPFFERAKLIPVDMMYGKYKLLTTIAILFFLSGLDRTGFLFSKMAATSFLPVVNAIGAYLAGIILAPLFLPYIPFRAFALKGAFWGAIVTIVLNLILQIRLIEGISLGLINLSIASFVAMNFTGSSTYTSLSGVKIEMKWAIPFQIVFVLAGIILFVYSKLI